MEFFDYLVHLWRYKWWLLIGLVVGAVAVGGYAATRADRYQATEALFVVRQTEPTNPQYFTYEGYYAQQVAASYADNAQKLLTSDEIVRRAAQTAGLAADDATVQRLKGIVTVKKDSTQLFHYSVTLPKRADATAFAQGLAQALKEKTTDLNQSGDPSLSVNQVNAAPVVLPAKPWWPLYAVAGAVAGLLLAIVASAIWSYLQHQRRRR